MPGGSMLRPSLATEVRIVFRGSRTVSGLWRPESGEIIRYFLMTAWSEAIFPSRM